MLSSQTIQTVQSTIPLLLEHGEAIGVYFYGHLLRENPDLKHIFNHANQVKGQQAQVIAQTIVTYAQRLNDLESLAPLIKQIVSKHTSIGVQPEQYAAVGASLMVAIQHVLELPDEHPALAAWADAYGALSDILITAEESTYSQNEESAGGWRGFRDFTISDVVTETPEVKSFYLEPADDEPILAFEGGQFVGVKFEGLSSGYDAIRQYSLSGKSGELHYRITTKAESGGLVSRFLHKLGEGDLVSLSAPGGSFTLDETHGKHIFIAAGVGITPLISMLYEALERGIPADKLVFIQCSRSSEHQIFREELSKLNETSPFFFRQCLERSEGDHHHGHITEECLKTWMLEAGFTGDDRAEGNSENGAGEPDDKPGLAVGSVGVYFCGPRPFMTSVNQLVRRLGFNDTTIHHEVFGPSNAL